MRRVAFLFLAFVVAGCGGAKSASVATVATTTTGERTVSVGGTTIASPALSYAMCMRSNGVRAFPDPSASGGFVIPVGGGVDPTSPAFRTAQAKCRRFMPGALAPGTTTHPTAQWLAQMVKAAQCMRRHGITDFPDPTTTVPTMPKSGRGVISDIDGVVFTFTDAIDLQSAPFVRAATACGFPLHNH